MSSDSPILNANDHPSTNVLCHAGTAYSKTPDPSQVLYDFLSPLNGLCREEALFYRLKGTDGAASASKDCFLRLPAGGAADLVTYFNAFSACKWNKYTNVDELAVFLDLEGSALVQLVQVTKEGESILASWKLEAEQRTVLQCPVISCPDDGIIGVRLFAETDCTFFGGGYAAEAPQTQAIRLGIGITTFKREKAAAASVARLRKAIAEHPLYNDAIDITVVDNGQTLSPGDVPGAALIPNANLGGSGGFMRSLIHYQDDGSCTHCLFMDDDASCEPGCLFRSLSFLRHAKDDALAVAGAMMLDTEPAIQWENGAFFDMNCQKVHSGYDMRDVCTLAMNEEEDAGQHRLYGGWWFFLFPLKKADMTVFPYFVRGDDIEFSCLNPFQVVTLNGVRSLQGDFRLKECPLVHYLEYRSHILLNMVLPGIQHRLGKIIKFIFKRAVRFNLSCHYDSAHALIQTLKNTAKGPDFWVSDADTAKIRGYIKETYQNEVLKPAADKNIVLPDSSKEELSFFDKIKSLATLNGHLLPNALIDKEPCCISKDNEYSIINTYAKQTVFVYDKTNNVGYTLRRDCRRFFANILSLVFYTIVFAVKYPLLKHQYLAFYKKLKKGVFWRSLYAGLQDKENQPAL